MLCSSKVWSLTNQTKSTTQSSVTQSCSRLKSHQSVLWIFLQFLSSWFKLESEKVFKKCSMLVGWSCQWNRLWLSVCVSVSWSHLQHDTAMMSEQESLVWRVIGAVQPLWCPVKWLKLTWQVKCHHLWGLTSNPQNPSVLNLYFEWTEFELTCLTWMHFFMGEQTKGFAC